MAFQWSDQKRLASILILLVFSFTALLFRLSWLQLVKGDELSRKAVEVRARDQVLEPKRGIIYDRNHSELVGDIPVKSVYVNPNIFSFRVATGAGEDKSAEEKSRREEIAGQIAGILGLDAANTSRIIDSNQKFAWLKHNVDYDTCQKLDSLIKDDKIAGIGFVEGSERTYPQGTMAAHVLGFVGMDPSARGGIEKVYDSELSGEPGHMVAESDASGRQLPQTMSGYVPPVPGKNIILTIDHSIQYFVEQELDKIVESYNPSKAVIIVMDPSNGEILAMGSRPSYDPAKYSNYPQQTWNSSPAVNYTYEPGSTLKMFVGAMALEEGTVKETDTFYDPGYIMVCNRRINCWDLAGHGKETFAEGVQNSCNPVFITVGLRSGKDLLYKYLKGFGFGQRTGIDLPGEEVGLIIPEDRVSELDLATMSIGQSIAVTPIQLITAMSALANGGTLIKPHLVMGVEDPQTQKITAVQPQVVRQVVSRETSVRMAKLLQRVILEGSGQKAYVEGYSVAGKTGTAQVPGKGGYEQGKYVASFAGFAPAENPRIAVLVMVAEPNGGQFYGGEVAAPAFQAVASETLHYLNVPESPDLPAPPNTQSLEGKSVPAGTDGLVTVPDVVGFPAEDARNYIEQIGLQPSLTAKEGLVSEQRPSGGSQVPGGTVVSLKIAKPSGLSPPGGVIVPDLKGLTIKSAGSILQQLNLNFVAVGSGYAVSQSTAPGKRVAGGTVVRVEFSP